MLFLDEVGDRHCHRRPLLRFLQERVIERIGGRRDRVDVRVVCATHRDLPALDPAGDFARTVLPDQRGDDPCPAIARASGDSLLLARAFRTLRDTVLRPVKGFMPQAVEAGGLQLARKCPAN